MIEQYSGRLPIWLSPIQIVICTIVEKSNNYAKLIYKRLIELGVRVEIDVRNEKIGFKIREHSINATPILLIIGEKEEENKTVAIRKLGSNSQEVNKLDDFLEDIRIKTLPPDLI